MGGEIGELVKREALKEDINDALFIACRANSVIELGNPNRFELVAIRVGQLLERLSDLNNNFEKRFEALCKQRGYTK